METLLLIVSALAVWRATHMLQDEEGPLGVFSRLQAWAASQPDKVGGINHGFFCFYCLSIWVAIIPAAFLSDGGILFWPYLLALSAGAVFLDLIHNSLDK